MISSPLRSAAPDPISAATALRAGGLRISASRRRLVKALYASREPRTAEELVLGPGRREPAARATRAYASCEACSTLVPLDDATAERIRAAARAACGFTPDLTHFPLVGRCPACAG